MRVALQRFFGNQRVVLLALLLVAFSAALLGQGTSTWRRLSSTPILSPAGLGWECAGAFNPAAVIHDGKTILIYRAQDTAGTSRLGYAESSDGIHFQNSTNPVFSGATDYEKDGGVEDPRLVEIAGVYYMTYTAYNKHDAQLCLAISSDLLHWQRKGILLPAYKGNWNVGWTKSGAILTQEIQGKYWMYWLGTTPDHSDQMGISSSSDLVHWTEETQTPVLPRRPGKFDSRVVEPGPPPILTPNGIVLIYNGADDQLVYRTGIAVFDAQDPRKLLYRSVQPVFQPELDWERIGQVPNVVFIEGLVQDKDGYRMYYGAADKFVGVASTKLLITK
jgi:beta-1,2-mannosidase